MSEQINWMIIRNEAYRWGNCVQRYARFPRWVGVWSLIRTDRRYWAIIGYHLHEMYRDVEEIRHGFGVTRMWSQNARLLRFAIWCSDRSGETPIPQQQKGPQR